ncbi:MAG TPA: DUF4383 domain-containing protein [Thermoleophilaceae bacterium]|jgi:hypothetical protein
MAATGARAAGAQPTTSRDLDHDKRTPAQWYCVLFGGTLLLVGLIGFLANASFVTGKELEDDPLLGLFDVNGWHNVVHVASGLVLLAFSKKRATAKAAALTFGIVYGLVTLIGFIDGSDVLAIIPTNTADNLLHLAISALAIASALMSSGDDKAIGRHAGADRADDAADGRGRVERRPAANGVTAGTGRTTARATGQGPVPPTRT